MTDHIVVMTAGRVRGVDLQTTPAAGLRPPAPADIDAVIFDAGGVLLLPDADAGRSAIAALGHQTSAEDWRRAHYATLPLLDQMGQIDWPAHRRAMAAEIGVPGEHVHAAGALIDEIMSRDWVAVDGAAAALQALADAGYQLAVVSNAGGTVAQWLERQGVCSVTLAGMPRVAIVVDSSLVGVEKPDPAIFAFALDALDTEPGRCLYIGDTVRFDVTGALAAGLHPVHVDPYGGCPGAHLHIAGLTDLTEWLAAGGAAAG